MNHRAPAALAIAALVSAPRMGTAGPCAPRAELDGEPIAVERVADELGRLGVTVASAAPGCPAVKAVVSLDRDGGIAVAVRGAAQRSEGRVVSDAALAAVWIDSWLRDDLDGWSAPPPARRVAVVETTSTPVLAPPSDVTPVAPARSVFERFAISFAYEQAWTDDGSSWSGGNIAACVRVGALCIGGRARGAWQPELKTDVSAAERSDLSVLATASLPIDLGNMFIAPEVGLGVGQFSTRRIDGCKPTMIPDPNCDPMDPMCVMPPPTMCDPTAPGAANGLVYVGDALDETSYTPRIALALRVAIPLFRHVWLDGLASYTIAPLGHRETYGAAAPNTPTMLFGLPGEPGTGVQLGVGIRVGAP